MQKLLIGREYPNEVIEAVKNAQNSIKILMYDWRWYSHEPGSRIQKLNQEIVRASARGVAVRAVLNAPSILSILKENGIDAKITSTSKTMHVKMVIVDNRILFLGSHNFSINGFELNHEISVILDDSEAIGKCNNFFETICHL